MSNPKIWMARLEDLPRVAAEISSDIAVARPFTLWLKGDLGAGKTTLTKFLLHHLGVPENVPVLSPTYTWLTEYKTPTGVVAHMDLYRLAEGDHDSVAMLLSGRDYQGLIIEWPERAESFDLIAPDAVIAIDQAEDPDERMISFNTKPII